MELNKEEKIRRFHYEEILLILFICASDLSNYSDDDLVNFTEDIEGRVEVLFESGYLAQFDEFSKLDIDTLKDFGKLKSDIICMYESGWHQKLKLQNKEWETINVIAKAILTSIDVSYVEPNIYKDNHLNIDWT